MIRVRSVKNETCLEKEMSKERDAQDKRCREKEMSLMSIKKEVASKK